MFLKTDGLVVRQVNYKDNDQILTVLTKEHGLMTLKARGVRSRSSRLKGACQLLAYSEFTVFENRGFHTIDEANAIQSQIDSTYSEAYLALQRANLTLGVCGDIAETVPVENNVRIEYRSVMGVAIPTVFLETDLPQLHYGFGDTSAPLDEAYIKFDKVKRLTARLAEVENCVYRLANAIKKTQKRANALRNIIIPRFTETVKYITLSLDEKDREEFSRLKVIKANKLKKNRKAE